MRRGTLGGRSTRSRRCSSTRRPFPPSPFPFPQSWYSPFSKSRSRCTTNLASSTSTSSPPCTRRCGGRTWRGRCTGWPGCWRGARIRCMSPAAWCASPPKTWGWRTHAPCPSRSRPRRPTTFLAAPRGAYLFVGAPGGEPPLARAVVYLAPAPKSNRVYVAFDRAMDAARQHPAEAVPLHIRNAPTKLMEDLGYGAGYQYAHAFQEAYVPQEYLPEPLRGVHWYEPSEFGYEKEIKKRLEWWENLKRERGKGKGET